MANVWSGAAVAAALREEYKNEAAALLKETGIVPGLAILRIGDVAEAKAYEAGIYALGEATGVKVSTVVLSEGVEEAGVIEAIEYSGDRFLVGVQWHPEELTGNEEAASLFRAFVEAAKK